MQLNNTQATSPTCRLMIVDAMNLIRRIYAVQERQLTPQPNQPNVSADSLEKSLKLATFSAVEQAIRKLRGLIQPTHTIAVFDETKHSWRHECFSEYKAGRKPAPDTLLHMLPELKHLMQNQWQMPCTSHPEFEADDVIASIAAKIEATKQQCTIISTDKGFLQLLNNHIHQFDYFARKVLDQEYCQEKFSLPSNKLCLFWGLAGDSGNNIPGVSGIGKKTALDILLHHTSMQAAIQSDKLTQRIKDKLIEQHAEFKLSLRLVTLRKDVELGLNLKQLRVK